MEKEQKSAIVRIITAGALMLAGLLLPVSGTVKLIILGAAYIIAGGDVVMGAVKNIIHGEVFDEEFLMTLATAGAFAIGEYPEAVAVMLFYQLGELCQDIAVDRSRESIAELMDIRPDSATVVRGGEELSVSPEDVEVGEIIVVRPGERIPLDGVVTEGRASVDTSSLTGESAPVERGESERVISGSIDLDGVIRVRVESEYGESTVSKILELVENASDKKARAESFITRFARWYTPCVVIGAVLLAVLPPLLFGQPWREWINRALIFLVVSCPCALVVSVPLSFFGGMGGASRSGILIKGASCLEALAGVDTVVFDKTGTLTKGAFAVEAVHTDECDMAEATASTTAYLLDIAAVAESYSSHPVAQSIVRAHGGHIDKSRLGEVTELAGKGVKAVVDGRIFYIGNAALMDEIGARWHDCALGGTVIHIADKDGYLGHIVINDELKPDSADALRKLKALGVRKTVMLTGDAQSVADRVGTAVGVDEIHAGLLPAQKVEQLESILAGGAKAAFVGDGVNDAPVLMRADVGIAMGALGSDAAIESADVVLMDDKPDDIASAISISRRTMRIVRENIAFSLAVKALILLLGALGIANMWTAVFGDVGVTLIAVLNALRALKTER